MVAGGMEKWRYDLIKKCNAPIKDKFFSYLVIQQKVLSHDVMLKLGLNCNFISM